MSFLVQRFRKAWLANRWVRTGILILSVFGPATIAAMADNDASGVATYSIAGATLGYPILFLLLIITVLLGMTQEMGMRLTLVTRRGLADLIREKHGVSVSLVIFLGPFVANVGTITTEFAAVRTVSARLRTPVTPFVVGILVVAFLFSTKGN